MHTYIKRNVVRHYVETEAPLPSNIAGGVGSTWEDFMAGMYVPLSEQQLSFRSAHPSASVRDVFLMEAAPVHVRTLEQAKNEKLDEISRYDGSDSVNDFIVNGMIHTWFTVQERLNYKESINAAKLLGKEEVAFFIGDVMLSVNCDLAIGMLAQIQDYADKCFIVTKQHKIAVNALETIEEVDGYDYAVGYPDKLEFNIA